MSEERETEARDTAKEAFIQTTPKKKNCKKATWLCEEPLQVAEKRKVKSKGEKKNQIHPSECRVPKNSKEREESLPQ